MVKRYGSVIPASESVAKFKKRVGGTVSFPRRRESIFYNALILQMDPRLREDDK